MMIRLVIVNEFWLNYYGALIAAQCLTIVWLYWLQVADTVRSLLDE